MVCTKMKPVVKVEYLLADFAGQRLQVRARPSVGARVEDNVGRPLREQLPPARRPLLDGD